MSELYNTRDWLFSNSDETLNKYAKQFGLNDEDIAKCNSDKKLTSDILMTRDSAIKDVGIDGTPAFIVVSKNKKELISGMSFHIGSITKMHTN